MSVKDEVAAGVHQLVLFTPELLLLKSKWRELLRSSTYAERTKAFVVDEAHCVKKWYVALHFPPDLLYHNAHLLQGGHIPFNIEKDWGSSEFVASACACDGSNCYSYQKTAVVNRKHPWNEGA